MSAVEKLWCAMCGKWSDHQSGSCPELHPVTGVEVNGVAYVPESELEHTLDANTAMLEADDQLRRELESLRLLARRLYDELNSPFNQAMSPVAERSKREALERYRSAKSMRCECDQWARAMDLKYPTDHHENCLRYNDSLMDVWRVTVDGVSCYTANEQDARDTAGKDITVIQEKMHREAFEALPEFEGF